MADAEATEPVVPTWDEYSAAKARQQRHADRHESTPTEEDVADVEAIRVYESTPGANKWPPSE